MERRRFKILVFRVTAAFVPGVLTCASAALQAATFKQDWVAPQYAPCEGVGVHGSFRVWVSGNYEVRTNGEKRITFLSVHTSSGAFTQLPGTTTATALVKVNGAVKLKVVLSRPVGAAVEASLRKDETSPVYLQRSKVIAMPKGAELWVDASVAVKTSSGMCGLGSSSRKISL